MRARRENRLHSTHWKNVAFQVCERKFIISVKTLKTAKAVNEDPACLYVGSHRRSNQPI